MWDLPAWGSALSPGNRGALRVCRLCPVKRQCEAEAMDNGDAGVIRAGVLFRTAGQWAYCETCGARFARAKNRGGRPQRFCTTKCRPLVGAVLR